MPELPEVETIKNMVAEVLDDSTIVDVVVRQRRFREPVPDDFEKIAKGSKVVSLKRIAKYLLIGLDNGYTLIWHFGMSGKFKICADVPKNLDKHDHIVLVTNKGVLVYNDVRRFGLVTYCDSANLKKHHLLCRLGHDPWEEGLTTSYLLQKFKGKKQPIKICLLDQEIICGIGNIYASEILYKARIRPDKSSDQISESEAEKIIFYTRQILEEAIKAGGSTIHDFKTPDGDTGHFQNSLCVYGRTGQRCPDCICGESAEKIKKIVMGGRSTFYCETLQK
ncbi:MAG: bifunctional DNA-formamidopyrimidine glycosylase/DNA-(apurinic or apyrimidinic site) lyase [Alphaproteobacteria bacterium]|nr:bifunctional DNA-formamidopyrimidine glycosylase/DNA-(apurinic or apyrimidinic site) lyase [Alphaproteobacteria bacterium]